MVLVKNKIIDKIIIFPDDKQKICELNKRWFNISNSCTRAINKQPTAMFLYGLEKCNGKYVLAVDSDIIVVRKDREHNYLNDMVNFVKKSLLLNILFFVNNIVRCCNGN